MNSSSDDRRSSPWQAETILVTAGRDTKAQKGFVNPPVVHGSTVLYATADDLHAHRGEFQYGRHGNADDQGAAAGADGARRSAMRRRWYRALGSVGDYHHPARGAESRRSSAGLRQRLPAHAQFLQRRAGPLWRRDHLFRSLDRRRHRRTVQAQYHARCWSRRPARKPSKWPTFRPSPPSRMRTVRW